MSLANFKPETRVVKGRNYELEVRGLCLLDLSGLLRTHMADLEHVFDLYEKQGTDNLSHVALGKFALALVKDAPGLVAHAIALACDEPDAVDKAAKLPFMAQVSALKDIGSLTFEEIGGVKKFLENINQLMAGLRPPQDEPQAGTD